MRLVPIPQSRLSAQEFAPRGLGVWELGRCVAPAYLATGAPSGRECGNLVRDDGAGYADLDGLPFRAYVCQRCAPRLLAQAGGFLSAAVA
jgi:hypothetical protein